MKSSAQLADGIPKIDATADMYIQVLDEDVACGVRRDPCECAVAQAIKAQLRDPNVRALIFPSRAWILMRADRETVATNRKLQPKLKAGDYAWHHFRIDYELQKQIVLFDKNGKTKAAPYRFRAPTKSQRLDAKRTRNATREQRRTEAFGKSASKHPRPTWLRERTMTVEDVR